MAYSCPDYCDDINHALGVVLDTDNVQKQADAALTEINRLYEIEKAHKARPATTMERMLYLVGPTNDQCDADEDGTVSRDLFVYAKDASEAVLLWRAYYGLDDDEVTGCPLGLTERVRVFEVPIMPNAATSTAVCWGDVHSYGATITERVEL